MILANQNSFLDIASLLKIFILQAMEQLVDKGLCKAIGISNFTVKKTKALLETAKIVPACNQGTVLNQYTMTHIDECYALDNLTFELHVPARRKKSLQSYCSVDLI